jgi:hypothetical protein
MFTSKDYRTRNFTTINKILGAQKLNRKERNTAVEQHLPINNKVNTYSNNQVQNIVKVNFIVIKFESTKSSISK